MYKHKQCNICKEEKDEEQFYKHRRQCIPCYIQRNTAGKLRSKSENISISVKELESSLENMSIADKSLDLFQQPEFKLLRINDDKSIELVTPMSLDIKVVYRCMSHIWGDVKRHVWKNHGIIGVNYPIRFRKEKRDKLLAIMKEYGGYWWVDLLCMNQNSRKKPLYLMEDIYKRCHECIAMVDCPEVVLHTVPEKNLELLEQLTKISLSDMIWEDKKVEEESYEYEPHYKDTPDVMPRVLLHNLTTLFKSTWFTRVWTLQEAVLSSVVLLTHETTEFNGYVNLAQLLDSMQKIGDYLCMKGYYFSPDFYIDNPQCIPDSPPQEVLGYNISDDSVVSSLEIHEDIWSDMHDVDCTTSANSADEETGHVAEEVSYVIRKPKDMMPVDRDYGIYLDRSFKKLYDSIQNISRLKDSGKIADTVKIISGLDRKCKYPQDYIYGISGLVGIKLDSGLNVRDAFHKFVDKLTSIDEDIAWREPDWDREHELYKCISSDNMKVVKDSNIIPSKTIQIREVREEIFGNNSDSDSVFDVLEPKTYVTVVIDGVEDVVEIKDLYEIIPHTKMDYKCEMISDITELIRSNSYIYVVQNLRDDLSIDEMMMISEKDIGNKFGLHDVRLNNTRICKLVQHNKIIGSVFMKCRCDERRIKEEKYSEYEKYQEGYRQFREDADEDVTEHHYADYLRSGDMPYFR